MDEDADVMAKTLDTVRYLGTYPDGVLFDGAVSAQTKAVVECFLERETAEAMILEAREDKPTLAEELRVEAIELALS